MEDRISRIAKMVAADDVETEEIEKPVHDISIECSYDPALSDIKFEDNFRHINCKGYNRDESFLAYEFRPVDYTAEDIFEITDYDELADEFGEEYDYLSYVSDFDAGSIAEIILSIVPLEELSSLFLEDFEGKNDFADWIEERSEEEEESDSRGTYGWLMDMLPEEVEYAINDKAKKNISLPSMDSLWKAAVNGDCGIGLKEGWSFFKSSGYSQGEVAFVFGKSEDIDDPGVQNAIEHMLWDTPIYCRIEVDGEEYWVDSEMNDNYDYNKDEVIKIMKRLMGDKWDDEIEEYLEDNLPDQPEYSY